MNAMTRVAMIRSFLAVFIFCLVSSAMAATAPPAAPSKMPNQDAWQKLVQAAKGEGKVTLYSDASWFKGPFVDTFLNRYGVQIEIIVARPTELAEKLQRERRAGLYLADAIIGGSDSLVGIMKPLGVLDTLEPCFMLPELTSPEEIRKTWWRGRLFWNDDARTSLSFMANPGTVMAINTNIVKPPITSYKDLLDPKWKGKIIFQDPTAGGGGFRPFATVGGVLLGWDFWREVLSKQEPIFTRDTRLQTEWVARGKCAIAFAPRTEVVNTFRDNGAPIDFVLPVEGVFLASGVGTIGRVTRPAHPNAIKLFINYLLSREGQTLYSRAGGLQSVRVDVPTDHLHPVKIRQAGKTYYVPEGDKAFARETEWKKIIDDIVKPYLK